ncbi:sensor histidine kinase [Dactylosporangium sucinum]|uniref:histidine kinase n=1 Tax=Dactylosporangium sucinum TaxID=1424081 RepID=A0A917WMV6_9ACTN|nr:HAMP domain-containing sensor histidine kinase [Dactylosporangium sucinum]GGM15914.1 sensor protein CutS [Dactylosporangium sucinum]
MRHFGIRTRLTLLYGVLFLLGGTILLGLTYLLVKQNIHQRNSGSVSSLPAEIKVDLGQQQIRVNEFIKELQARQERIEQDTLDALITQGSIALGLVTVIGVGFGWLMAERALRPVGRITETARRVAGGNLHERIALRGPADEIKELADTFDSMLERLDQAFDGQRRFAANASHELRTPLTINRTLIEVALGRPSPPPELVQLGETLLAVNARHERLIDGLLTLVASEQALTVHDPVDLAEVARHVVGERPIEVALQPAPTVGDPVLLERVVQNLVDNALAYNVPDGQVWVSTGPTWVTVSNTGPVVPPYEIPGLFEPFRRLRSRTGSAHGTGLGLSIVRSVATAHGGSVDAGPRDGGGLTVTVTLPTRK